MSEILEHYSSDTGDSPVGEATPTGMLSAPETGRPTLSVVIPTKNEAGNVEPLIAALSEALVGIDAEVIFVDDSDDETGERVQQVAAAFEPLLSIRLIERHGSERTGGLSGAVLRGLASARSRWVCVMDGDLQHPPEVIVRMMELADGGEVDLVSASRYCATGSNGGLSRWSRKAISSACGQAARSVFSGRLATVSDPMSGFFLVDRTRLDLDGVEPQGFKILLELIVGHPDLRLGEVPFTFGPRYAGESKANLRQGVEFGRQVARLKRRGRRRLWNYDLHGILTVQSERALPELEKFIVPSLSAPASITVRIAKPGDMPLGESVDVRGETPTVRYRERTGFAMSLNVGPSQIAATVSPFVARSPHVMYTNVVEPILRWRLVELGYALVHAACFADDERGFLVTARTDTGKTTTMLKVLDHSSLRFVSDDLIIVSADGVIRSFPKPLTISAHTVHALRETDLNRRERMLLVPQSRVHSREGRLLAFLLTKYRLPVASINAIIQRVVPPPKYHVERLVLGVQSAAVAQVTGMFVIQRGGSGEDVLEPDEALSILLSNCDDAFGFPPYESLERLLLAVADEDLRLAEREIVSSALSGAPARLLRSDTLDWATRIPSVVSTWTEHSDGRAPAEILP